MFLLIIPIRLTTIGNLFCLNWILLLITNWNLFIIIGNNNNNNNNEKSQKTKTIFNSVVGRINRQAVWMTLIRRAFHSD